MTVAELRDRMDADEFMGWQEYDRVHVSESWYQTALICSVLVKVMTGQCAPIENFLPDRNRAPAKPPDSMDIMRRMAAFRERHNARHGTA